MKKTTLAIIGLAAVTLAGITGAKAQTIITQWNFNGNSTSPTTGSGTASLIGGTTATFASGNGSGFGWNTSSYPAQGAGNGTAGVEFMVSTVGFTSISITFDHRASGTASRWAQLDYSTDGGTSWTSFWNNSGGLSPHDTFYSFSVDLTSITAVENNPNFGFRIVSIFSPQAFQQNSTSGDIAANTQYMRANAQAVYVPGTGTGTGTYGTSGTWRFDNVTVVGIPEPTAATLLLVGLGAYVIRRRMTARK